MSLFDFNNSFIFGNWLVFGIPIISYMFFITGVFLAFTTRLAVFRLIPIGWAAIRTESPEDSAQEKGRKWSTFMSFSSIVAANLGVGTMIGAYVAFQAVGYSAIVWIPLCAIISGSIKFAEVLISCKFKNKEKEGCPGGMSYVGRSICFKFFQKYGKKGLLSRISPQKAEFASGLLWVIPMVSLPMIWSGMQLNQVVSAFFGHMDVLHINYAGKIVFEPSYKHILMSVGISTFCVYIIFGGLERIGTILPLLIFPAFFIYLFSCTMVVINSTVTLSDIYHKIVADISHKSFLTSVLGWFVVFKRISFATESGLGTAGLMHSMSRSEPLKSASSVCLDTIIVSTIFLLSFVPIICGQAQLDSNEVIGVEGIIAAFDRVFSGLGVGVKICAFIFGTTTIIGNFIYIKFSYWYFSSKHLNILRVVYFCAIIFFSFSTIDALIKISDAVMVYLIFINLFIILIMRKHFKNI